MEDAPYRLERIQDAAFLLEREGYISLALSLYYRLAELDPSLEAGEFAFRIGRCYLKIGDKNAARYWFRRATQENPGIAIYVDYLQAMGDPDIKRIVDDVESGKFF